MRSSPQTYPYPESESKLQEWEWATLASVPQARIVKLAFRKLNFAAPSVLNAAIEADNYPAALEHFFLESAPRHTAFLSQLRLQRSAGHSFVRFHAVETEMSARRRSPHIHDTYWRRLSLFYAYLNGPFGGETTYAVPSDIANEVGMTTLRNEAHVIISPEIGALGSCSLKYSEAGDRILSRTFYDSHEAETTQARDIVTALTSWEGMSEYRLPHVMPTQDTSAALGLTAIASTTYQQANCFADLLPPALRA